MLLIEWLHLIRISLLQTLQNIIGWTWVFKSVPHTTRRKRHFPYKNCLTVALRRQIRVRIQVIQLCWLCSVQCTLVQRRQAVQHRTDYLELVPQQHSLSVIHLMPILPRCGCSFQAPTSQEMDMEWVCWCLTGRTSFKLVKLVFALIKPVWPVRNWFLQSRSREGWLHS